MFRQKNVGAKWVLVLWAVEWAWHPAEITCAVQEVQETTCQIPTF